ncbi:alpha/beta hydrolase [Anaerovibrio lipolyticus]|uniref:alpha/beta hydrolase n=1 Tax=Anaerovibrio lipolyticus TaxID=82374 RepID=UPI0026EA872C|nr:alpha/beta hydrolase-fold protein [Anaerovibrio lipolyticus]MBE6105662.1 alpha/beta hydrolase [Anaerovibrio lipolyticus]
MKSLVIAGKEIQIFPSKKENAPLVILHTVHREGEKVYQMVLEGAPVDFSLAAIGNLAWDDEMSPWEIPTIARGDTPCTGGADAYLGTLTEKILPKILSYVPSPSFMALAGYSLAGLFAVYAMYHTDVFERIASASGSFWYPNFQAYVLEHEMKRQPKYIYFSLGNKEAKTRNKILQSVEENTRWLEKHYREFGIRTVYEENQGNHFQNANERMAKGICWILQ